MAEGKFRASNHAHILSVPEGIKEYFCENIELKGFLTLATCSAQPKLTKETIANLELVVPPILEQRRIIDFIKKSSEKIDNLKSKFNSQIEKLKEYRQSVISEAETGKVKVV